MLSMQQTPSQTIKIFEVAMITALKSVAFANSEKSAGVVALLQTALEALDEDKEHLVAACVSQAIDRYRVRLEQRSKPDFGQVTETSS
jgi:hypothetical protein